VATVVGPIERTADVTTLLVVEDNPVNKKVVVVTLSRHGYSVDTAINGVDALRRLADRDYAAVLMDCQMPIMDGYEATRQLRLREGTARHTPVIALTASVLTGAREQCLEAGMDDYLAKPLQVDDLMAALLRWSAPSASPC
jgi:two-component system sensor histidine kinase/response regulator